MFFGDVKFGWNLRYFVYLIWMCFIYKLTIKFFVRMLVFDDCNRGERSVKVIVVI